MARSLNVKNAGFVIAVLAALAGFARGGYELLVTGASAAEPVPAPAYDDALQLTFAGDLMAHSVNYGMRDFSEPYRGLAGILHHDDLSFVNLEFPIDPNRPYSSYPRFNVHPEYVEAAVDAGFDVFSLANNHTADWHVPGIVATLESMEALAAKSGTVHSGIRGAPGSEFAVSSIEHDGWSIGFISVTQFSNEWREYAGLDRVYLVSHRDRRRADAFVRWLETQTDGHDLFVLAYHGGVEYALTPDPAKMAFFRRLVDAGVDIVWGHHPHVLQPWEMVTRADGSHGLILPSTGNFISGQPSRLSAGQWPAERAATGDTALYRVQADRAIGGGGSSTRVELTLAVTPLIHRRHSDGVAIVPLPSGDEGWAVYEGQRRRISLPQRLAAGPLWFAD